MRLRCIVQHSALVRYCGRPIAANNHSSPRRKKDNEEVGGCYGEGETTATFPRKPRCTPLRPGFGTPFSFFSEPNCSRRQQLRVHCTMSFNITSIFWTSHSYFLQHLILLVYSLRRTTTRGQTIDTCDSNTRTHTILTRTRYQITCPSFLPSCRPFLRWWALYRDRMTTCVVVLLVRCAGHTS